MSRTSLSITLTTSSAKYDSKVGTSVCWIASASRRFLDGNLKRGAYLSYNCAATQVPSKSTSHLYAKASGASRCDRTAWTSSTLGLLRNNCSTSSNTFCSTAAPIKYLPFSMARTPPTPPSNPPTAMPATQSYTGVAYNNDAPMPPATTTTPAHAAASSHKTASSVGSRTRFKCAKKDTLPGLSSSTCWTDLRRTVPSIAKDTASTPHASGRVNASKSMDGPINSVTDAWSATPAPNQNVPSAETSDHR
mmetsp:Transcript_19289/g.59542  ORF Transcript_19289/g.59542 Transcript_19289/m.59542 type:complete len:249 (-) Transcript_19289:422-1168(-)